MSRFEATARYFPAFQSPDYRRLWFASGASSASVWGMLMARAWIALELTDSGLAVGAVTFAGMIPWLLAPLGGALADRYDRARVLQIAASLQIVGALLLAALVLTDVVTLWHLIVFAAINGVLWAGVELPTQQALVPNTVDRSSLMNAVLLFGLTPAAIGRLLGPLAGGPLLAGVGAGWIFVLAAIMYTLGISQLRRIEIRSSGGAAGSNKNVLAEVGANIRHAMRFLGQNRRVRLVIAMVTVHCTFTMGFDAMLPIHVQDQLGGGVGAFGFLLIGIGVGALVGILSLITVTNDRTRGRVFFVSGIVSGCGLAWLGLAPTVGLAFIGTFAMGAGGAVFVALAATFIQEVTPDEIRGGVMSVFLMFAGGVMPIMSFANGAASDTISTDILIAVPAFLFITILIVWSIVGHDLRGIYRRGAISTSTSTAPAPATATPSLSGD